MKTRSSLELNRELHKMGLTVLPIVIGQRMTAVPWSKYRDQEEVVADQDLFNWWGPNQKSDYGTVIVTGPASCWFAAFDFDQHCDPTIHEISETFESWRSQCESIVARLPIIETPSFGYHVWFRCEQAFRGYDKIIAATDSGQATIELLVNNVVPATTNPAMQKQKPEWMPDDQFTDLYIQSSGPTDHVPAITAEEFKMLYAAAMKLDEGCIHQKKIAETKHRLTRRRAGLFAKSDGCPITNNYNATGCPAELLESVNWQSRNGVDWTHPEATSNVSARVLKASTTGEPIIRCFSTNTPLEPGRNYSLFEARKVLLFQGDKDATKASLRKELGDGN